jgi:hypothetical protein
MSVKLKALTQQNVGNRSAQQAEQRIGWAWRSQQTQLVHERDCVRETFECAMLVISAERPEAPTNLKGGEPCASRIRTEWRVARVQYDSGKVTMLDVHTMQARTSLCRAALIDMQ